MIVNQDGAHLQTKAATLVIEAERYGYQQAMTRVGKRLRALSLIVPHSTNKMSLIEAIEREAELCEREAKESI